MGHLFPKKVRTLFWCIFAVGLLLSGAGISQEAAFLSGLGLVVMLGSLAFYLIFYRCPHCGKFLDRSTGDFCPHCGKRVNPQQPPRS